MEEKPKIIEQEEIKKQKQSINVKKILEKPDKKKRKFLLKWPLIVLLITFVLSFLFSFASEFMLSDAGIVVSVILLIFFLALAMITDMIGVAVTAAEIEPFNAMSSKKIRGAKESIILIKNAEKVSSIFCDIVGDICGILSGTIGATFVIQILGTMQGGITEVLVASLVSAIIAALTVFLKSVGKTIAINKANNIIFILGKIISFFKFKK